MTREHIEYLNENQIKPSYSSWVNVAEAHAIEVVKIGSHYYVKAVFATWEHYYIAFFDSEIEAKNYVNTLLD